MKSQIAGPVKKAPGPGESFDSYTPPLGVPAFDPQRAVTKQAIHTPTNLNVLRDGQLANEPYDVALDRRVRDTKNNTITTLTRIEELRKEFEAKYEKQNERFVALQLELTKSTTQNEVIIGLLNRREAIADKRAHTDIDLDAEERRARIANENANQNLTRAVKLRAVGTLLGGTGIVALLLALISQRC